MEQRPSLTSRNVGALREIAVDLQSHDRGVCLALIECPTLGSLWGRKRMAPDSYVITGVAGVKLTGLTSLFFLLPSISIHL